MCVDYLEKLDNVELRLISDNVLSCQLEYDLDKIIFDLNSEIDILSSQADSLDYIVAVASGLACGILDILWVGEFDLNRGREIASDQVDGFVKKTAKMLGCKDADNYKTWNDIQNTKVLMKNDSAKNLKEQWLLEWKRYMSAGFSSFLQVEDAELHWFTKEELMKKIAGQNPNEPWYRLVLLEAMLFEPYFPLSVEKNKKGEEVPSNKI